MNWFGVDKSVLQQPETDYRPLSRQIHCSIVALEKIAIEFHCFLL